MRRSKKHDQKTALPPKIGSISDAREVINWMKEQKSSQPSRNQDRLDEQRETEVRCKHERRG